MQHHDLLIVVSQDGHESPRLKIIGTALDFEEVSLDLFSVHTRIALGEQCEARRELALGDRRETGELVERESVAGWRLVKGHPFAGRLCLRHRQGHV
jgi:hypothetical protein